MSDTINQIKEIIASTLSVEEDKVIDDAHIVDDLGADSLAKVELVMKLEEEFDLDISDSDSENISTVKNVIDYVVSKKGS